NIAGDVDNVRLQIPKMAKVTIGGDALNFFYTGQNLRAVDVTEINIAGQYKSRGDRTAITVRNQLDLSIFDPHITINPELGAKLTYNPLTGQLIFQGKMTVDERNFLLNPQVKATDVLGNVRLDINGLPILTHAVFASAVTVNTLFDSTQDVPSFPTQNGGIFIGGPGKLLVSANKMDLGITAGIRSVVTALNPNLARLGNKGASIQITLASDLDMTSSQISSFDGGDISIVSGGRLSIGSQEQFTSDDTPKGIYTGHGGNLSVVAAGDINIKGSRVATYDGGNITVTSQNGSVDAGEGAKGFFSIVTQQYNPVTHQIENRNDKFFGSGIIALTRQDSFTKVGDITVKAKQDIKANSGGILQLAFNASDRSHSTVSLDAGQNIEANESGILGANVNLKAGGDIAGLVIANQNINIDARQNINVTAVASGGVAITSGGSVSGTIVGGGNVSVAGDSISASVISASGNASTSGDSVAAKVGGFNGVAAPAAQQTTTETEKAVEKATRPDDLDDNNKNKGMAKKGPVLSKSTGRVTVILPNTK
ncbi:MAG: hypothetical protein JWM04_692, partial [Verrucomicrobiales bacterium]|nr:hypothetical protein [Verrucomicrobiales bacterium]